MADKQSVYEITSFKGGIASFEDKGIPGAFKFGKNLDIRKFKDSLSAGQALMDIGDNVTSASRSPSASLSPSASTSPSISPSISPSASVSPSITSPSSSKSPSASRSPSASSSPSASISPSYSVSPSPSPSAGLTTVFADLVRFWVPASDGNTYGFGHTGKVYKITPELQVYQVFDLRKPITGAIEKPSASGQTWFLFATRTELHIKELPGRSDWNDVDKGLIGWPKTNLTDADWHTMALSGGAAMIANGSKVAMVGYDDSYTTEAVDLIPGNIVKTIVERNGRSVFGTYRAADPNKGINSAIDSEVPLAQVGDDGQIVYADFVSSLAVKRFPGGGKTNPGGAANRISQVNFFDWEPTALSWIDKQEVGNMAIFGVYAASSGYGGLYSYGRKDKEHQFVLNLDYALDVDEIGAVVTVNGLDYISYRSGSAFGVKVTDSSNKATGTYQGLDFRAPVKTPEDITAWNTAELYMDSLPAGASVQFWYRLDKAGSFIQANLANGLSSYSQAGGSKATFLIGAKGDIFEPQVVVVPSGNNSPEIYRIRVYFN